MHTFFAWLFGWPNQRANAASGQCGGSAVTIFSTV